MNAPASHNALQATESCEATCAECRHPFAARRRWQRFCCDQCKNDFHGRERRRKAIEKRAVTLYQALAAIASGADPVSTAQAAIDGLKAP